MQRTIATVMLIGVLLGGPSRAADDVLPAAHEPLDLVVIPLGTDDTKAYLDRTPFEIGLGAGEPISIVHESPGWDWTDYPSPEVLLISPPPLGEDIDPLADEVRRVLGE